MAAIPSSARLFVVVALAAALTSQQNFTDPSIGIDPPSSPPPNPVIGTVMNVPPASPSPPPPTTSWDTFVSGLNCFENTTAYAYVTGLSAAYPALLVKVATAPPGSQYQTFNLTNTFRAVYFRQGSLTYIRIERNYLYPSATSYVLKYYLFRDDQNAGDCFRVAPASCTFNGDGIGQFESVCRKERYMTYQIKKGAVKLAINQPFSASQVVQAISDCISQNIQAFSVSIDCALGGLSLDPAWLLSELNSEAAALNALGYVATVDPVALTLNYTAPVTSP